MADEVRRRPRSSASAIESVVSTISQEGGQFTLTYDPELTHNKYTGAMEWGKEAEDSPMAGAAAYGIGSSASEAINMMLDEADL